MQATFILGSLKKKFRKPEIYQLPPYWRQNRMNWLVSFAQKRLNNLYLSFFVRIKKLGESVFFIRGARKVIVKKMVRTDSRK